MAENHEPERPTSAFETIPQHAELTGQHYTTIARAVRSGKIPGVRRGGVWLIPVSYRHELEAEAYANVRGDG